MELPNTPAWITSVSLVSCMGSLPQGWPNDPENGLCSFSNLGKGNKNLSIFRNKYIIKSTSTRAAVPTAVLRTKCFRCSDSCAYNKLNESLYRNGLFLWLQLLKNAFYANAVAPSGGLLVPKKYQKLQRHSLSAEQLSAVGENVLQESSSGSRSCGRPHLFCWSVHKQDTEYWSDAVTQHKLWPACGEQRGTFFIDAQL